MSYDVATGSLLATFWDKASIFRKQAAVIEDAASRDFLSVTPQTTSIMRNDVRDIWRTVYNLLEDSDEEVSPDQARDMASELGQVIESSYRIGIQAFDGIADNPADAATIYQDVIALLGERSRGAPEIP